jgi:hypothetical protein
VEDVSTDAGEGGFSVDKSQLRRLEKASVGEYAIFFNIVETRKCADSGDGHSIRMANFFHNMTNLLKIHRDEDSTKLS